ncbi:MAG TPA: deoxyribodipyrimidine photolyase [Alphaproteobacteria bacterium]|nr:deoxyribodipyrimidine photolyase [Alphaproteobacteria bacterium]
MHSILWFRQDLRVNDNPALNAAIENSNQVVAVYILDEQSKNHRQLGGASKVWLHYTLADLQKSLKEKYQINLVLKIGKSVEVIGKLFAETRAEKLYFNRCYEPYFAANDAIINKKFNTETFNASLLVEPNEVKNGSGEYFKVYTAFYKKCLSSQKLRSPLKAPNQQDKGSKLGVSSLKLEELKLLPTKPDWAAKFKKYWVISENAAHENLEKFFHNGMKNYSDNRNFADNENGTSKLSPYLHFGQISPHQILSATQFFSQVKPDLEKGGEKFINEIYWREFSYNLLGNFNDLPKKNFRPEFNNFPWDNNSELLHKWKWGKTGFPIVDAGMRELYETGYMHNRVRMIVGSFLTKNLLTHWKNGEEWFWDNLFDADLANNSASWQWVAGSGADAAPYFRIFNPVIQGKKFDPSGRYTKKWCPELKDLPIEYLHNPWESPELVIRAAGVELGKNYPKPIVTHEKGREIALKAYALMRKN